MRKQKILIDFSKYSDEGVSGKAKEVMQSMTTNPEYATPIPALTVLQTAIDEYDAALLNAADRVLSAIVVKNERRAELEGVLKQLGMYVMCVANGSKSALSTSGFTLSKTPEPIYIANPGNVKLSQGVTSGMLHSYVPAVKGAKSYLHQICAVPATFTAPAESVDESQWISNTSSRSHYTYTGLVPGQKYMVRVAAIGSKNQITYGDANAIYVQ